MNCPRCVDLHHQINALQALIAKYEHADNHVNAHKVVNAREKFLTAQLDAHKKVHSS